jgi:hypothetical protein
MHTRARIAIWIAVRARMVRIWRIVGALGIPVLSLGRRYAAYCGWMTVGLGANPGKWRGFRPARDAEISKFGRFWRTKAELRASISVFSVNWIDRKLVIFNVYR